MSSRRSRITGPRAAGAGLVALGLLASGCGGGDSADGRVTIRCPWGGGQDRADPINRAVGLGTDWSGLAAIQDLALIGDHLPE